jgi:hypothetical protein
VSSETSEAQPPLEAAIESCRHARELQNDALEGAEHILTLAMQALEQPTLARKLLLEIAATADNTVTCCEDAVSTFAGARVSVSKAREFIRRTAKTEQTEDSHT